MHEKPLLNILPNHALLTFAFTASLLVSLSCSTQMNYYRAKTYYAEENYESALRSVNAALQAKPRNEDFLLLRSNIIIALYRSHGLPVIAFHHLSQNEARTLSPIDSLRDRRTLLNEIKAKFTVPILMRFSDGISETDRQFMKSTIARNLRESSGPEFCELRLVEHPDTSASVVLEILLENYVATETKAASESVWSEYRSGTRLEPNPAYLRLISENRRLIQWQQYLTDLQTNPTERRHWDAEHYLVAERLYKLDAQVKQIGPKLASTPPHVSKPEFTAYQFLQRDYVLKIETVFKYRMVDLSHRLVWTEETARYTDTRTLQEIQNVHPDDATGRQNQEVAEEDIGESYSMMKRQMYSELAEELKNATAKILYYRARDYQTLGLHADAWEHYYVFLKTLEPADSDEAYYEARSMVDQDPLTFPLLRGEKIPADRKPPTMETAKVARRQGSVPPPAAAPAEEGAHTRRLARDLE